MVCAFPLVMLRELNGLSGLLGGFGVSENLGFSMKS